MEKEQEINKKKTTKRVYDVTENGSWIYNRTNNIYS